MSEGVKTLPSSLLNNTNYFIVLKYFILLFILDYSTIMNLYGQNFVRRWINMLRRRDYYTYKDYLKPFCEHTPKFLDENDVKLLQSIKNRMLEIYMPFLEQIQQPINVVIILLKMKQK